MKKIILSLLTLVTVSVAFWACDKNEFLESATLTNSKLKIPELSFAKARERFIEKASLGDVTIAMPINQLENDKFIFIIEEDEDCDIVATPEEFWELREKRPDMSLTSVRMLNKDQLEITVLMPDMKSFEKIKAGNAQNLLVTKNAVLIEAITETFKLPKGAFLEKGEYSIEQTEQNPYGRMIVTLGNPELSLRKLEEQFEANVSAGRIAMGMHLQQEGCWPEVRTALRKCKVGCFGTNLPDFLAMREKQNDISLAFFELLDENTLSISVAILDEISRKKAQDDNFEKALNIANDLELPDNVRETLKLREGAYFPAGNYAIKQSDEFIEGTIEVKIAYNK